MPEAAVPSRLRALPNMPEANDAPDRRAAVFPLAEESAAEELDVSLNLKWVTGSAELLLAVTVLPADVFMFPDESRATAVRICVPSDAPALSQFVE